MVIDLILFMRYDNAPPDRKCKKFCLEKLVDNLQLCYNAVFILTLFFFCGLISNAKLQQVSDTNFILKKRSIGHK